MKSPMPMKIPQTRLITIIASLLMGASSLLVVGMTLEDTQGRTLEAENVRLSGQSVSFTRADTGQEFTVPLATFSESTRKSNICRLKKSGNYWGKAKRPFGDGLKGSTSRYQLLRCFAINSIPGLSTRKMPRNGLNFFDRCRRQFPEIWGMLIIM